MDTIQHHRALLGMCRQRAQMDGEDVSFWLEEAAIRERLLLNAERLEMLSTLAQEKRPAEAGK
jgi:hypothetical protein